MSDLNHEHLLTQSTAGSLDAGSHFKRNCLGVACSLVIALGGSNLALAGDDGDHHGHHRVGPDGHSYAVKVKSSFGSDFYDCFTFDKQSPGALAIKKLYGQKLTYAHDYLNDKEETEWQASSNGYDGFGIAFHGNTEKHDYKIEGNAVNEYGDTFEFKGVKVPFCKDEDVHRNVKGQDANPYKK